MRKIQGYLYFLVVTIVSAGRNQGLRRQLGYCLYNGCFYNVGERFPASDGCNRCYCAEPWQVHCTIMHCPDLCELPIEPGNGIFPSDRWGYNSVTGQCVSFSYRGCDGNNNRFVTVGQCLQRCGGRTAWTELRIG